MSFGFLIIDKPGGMTSTQAVNRVKRATGVKKVGHAGTLDPMATGVLVVAVGKVTRLIRFVQDQPKEYVASAVFGVATDSLDADGAVLSREPMDFAPAELEELVPRFSGTIHQVPPMVSALKHEGRRLHELAREGTVIERAARPIEIYELEMLSIGPGPYPEVTFRVVCGKGTYVRSLANDMAGALGGAAHLNALRRTKIGSLGLDRALPTDQLEDWEDSLLSPSDGLIDLEAVSVDEETGKAVRHGMPFVAGPFMNKIEGEPVRVLDQSGDLLAVYSRQDDVAKAEVVLPQ